MAGKNPPPAATGTPPRNSCKNCGTLTHWPLCPTCYRWRIHFNAVQQAMRALRGRI